MQSWPSAKKHCHLFCKEFQKCEEQLFFFFSYLPTNQIVTQQAQNNMEDRALKSCLAHKHSY